MILCSNTVFLLTHWFLISVLGKPGTSATCDLENLPDDLKELVANDNKLFAEEIDKWDRDAARKTVGSGDADVCLVSEQKPGMI